MRVGRVVLASTMIAAGLIAVPTSADAVIGGSKSTYAPWAVRMLVDGQGHCTGTAITNEWVVTASHCFFDQPDKPVKDRRITFRVGNLDQRAGRTVKPVKGSRVPAPNGADVMLIKVPDLGLPKKHLAKLTAQDAKPGRRVRVYGWGATCEDDENSCQANNLRQAELKVRSRAFDGCEYYAAPGGADFCATKVRGVPAGGDSGGPVMTVAPDGQERLIGVFWGSDRESMTGAASMSHLITWVRRTTGKIR